MRNRDEYARKDTGWRIRNGVVMYLKQVLQDG